MDIYEQIVKANQENRSYALATVVQTEGTAPRSAGAKMLVYGDGTVIGTVGGGIVEKKAVQDCIRAIRTGEPLLKTYSATTPETAESGLVCGNNMTVFIEPGNQRPYLYLCGCGHVAQAVLPLAKALGYYVVAIDARDVSGFADALKPADELHILERFSDMEKMQFAPNASYLVCSYSHGTDGEILDTVLKQAPAYVGMLGGKPKIRALFRRLLEQGHPEAALRQVHAPVGLDIGGEQPAEIALSVMAEIQAARCGGSCRSMSELLRDSIFPL